MTPTTPSQVRAELAGPGWSLVLLGGFHLRDHAGTAPPMPMRAKRLIALLALSGPAPRMVAAEALWPEATHVHAQSNLRTTARQVRASCPGLLDDSVDPLSLDPSTAVDVDRLRGHDAATVLGVQDLLVDAELLPGWYDDWVLFDRERLRLQRLLLLERHAHELITTDHALALTLATRCVELDPLRESAQRALIEVHLAMGNRIEALRAYREFRIRSLREFGVEPSAQMEALIGELRAEQHQHSSPRNPDSRPRRPRP